MSPDSNHMDSIFRAAGLIGYLVKRLNEDNPDKQIGKTIVQKMMYLLSRKNIARFDFSMYHYGPYSSELSGEISFAERNGIIKVAWKDNEGYFIRSNETAEQFFALLDSDERQAVDYFVRQFGKFNATDLSLVATALYLKDNFGVEDSRLPEAVHNAKKKYSTEYIEKVLKSGGILQN
ncbi:MAG: hypothetical protein NTU95_04325 [Methanothrix sp.]|nr:hypothetical protein [Methanothrix sp.]